MDSAYSKELRVAIGAIQQAGRLGQSILSQTQNDAVVSKDDLSPVTVADFAIQALLTCTLHHAFPDDKFVGEESAQELRKSPALLDRVWLALQIAKGQQQQHGTEAAARFPDSPEQMCEMIDWCGVGRPDVGGRIWVFDPIDGTENFVKGLLYAINVALLDDGKQVLSVVGCPNMSMDIQFPAADDSLDPQGEGSIVFGVQGHGAFIRKLHGSVDEVPVRKLPRHAETAQHLCSVSCNNSSGLPSVHQAVARRLGIAFPGNNLLPWVIRWVLLALNIGNTTFWVYRSRSRLAKIWDHAGAMLLFQEVGGKVTDIDGKEVDLAANRQMTANYGFVAAPANLHHHVLDTVRHVLLEEKPELMEVPS